MTKDDPLWGSHVKNGERLYECNRPDIAQRLRHEDGIRRRARTNPWLGHNEYTPRIAFEQFEEVRAMFIDPVIDLAVLAAHLQDGETKTVVDSWDELMAVLEFNTAMLATNAALRAPR